MYLPKGDERMAERVTVLLSPAALDLVVPAPHVHIDVIGDGGDGLRRRDDVMRLGVRIERRKFVVRQEPERAAHGALYARDTGTVCALPPIAVNSYGTSNAGPKKGWPKG